jgi:uncharacterized protein (DUF1501 family)
MITNRRTFLKSLGGGAMLLGGGLMPRLARAQTASVNRSFIFAYFSGGWDTLLCLDPRDPNVFTDSRIAETKIQLAWDRIPAETGRTIIQPSGSNIEFGPVMGGIANHFDKLSIVRGISMDTVTHEVGRRYMITGMTPRGLNAAGSAMGTRIAAAQGDVLSIPSLVSRSETYNEGDPPFASGLAVNGASDLVLTLQDGSKAPTGAIRTRLDEYRARALNCDPAALDKDGIFGLIRETQTKARGLVTSGLANLFNFNDQQNAEIVDLRNRYGITNNFNANDSAAQAALAFQAIRHSIAQTVSIEIASGLDTHDDSWEDDHPNTLQTGFSALGQLVTDLASTNDEIRGGKLLDHTTIVAFSEFGRTALLNTRDGRDHSLTSAAMLIGAGVPHNKVIGGSSDTGMNPLPINPQTGEVESGGITITPNNIMASIMQSAGFDTDKLRTDGIPVLIA